MRTVQLTLEEDLVTAVDRAAGRGEAFEAAVTALHSGITILLLPEGRIRFDPEHPPATGKAATGVPQAQIGRSGLSVSARDDGQILSEPSDKGNMQPQHTSVTGLTKLPEHRPGPLGRP